MLVVAQWPFWAGGAGRGGASHRVGDVVGHALPEHRRGQSGVDVLGVQLLVLAVEHERRRVAAQQVGEGAAGHGEAEHRPVLGVGAGG